MQSAIDQNCHYRDFLKQENTVVISRIQNGHKNTITEPHFCQLVCYGNALVASVDPEIETYIDSFVKKYPGFRCFEKFKEKDDDVLDILRRANTFVYVHSMPVSKYFSQYCKTEDHYIKYLQV